MGQTAPRTDSLGQRSVFTFSRLGRLGRFGNQLFQIAGTIGLAERHRADFVFPPWEFSGLFRTPIPQVDRLPNPDIIISHRCFHYVDLAITTTEKCTVDIDGYLQSERFFIRCADVVKSYLEPCPAITVALEAGYGALLRKAPSCIMVVRRGDFVRKRDKHVPQDAAFYQSAMDEFDSGTTFFVTSDDIEWCHRNLRGKNFVFLPQRAWIHNFFLGTSCQHAIIANSTFGWWFAYLNKNPNKRVIAAKNWFGPALRHLNTRDLLPDGWKSI